MCAWIAVPAAGVLGIIEWLNHQFGLGLTGGKAVIVGSLVLCFWCVLSLYKNVVAGKVQSFMLMAGIAGILNVHYFSYSVDTGALLISQISLQAAMKSSGVVTLQPVLHGLSVVHL